MKKKSTVISRLLIVAMFGFMACISTAYADEGQEEKAVKEAIEQAYEDQEQQNAEDLRQITEVQIREDAAAPRFE